MTNKPGMDVYVDGQIVRRAVKEVSWSNVNGTQTIRIPVTYDGESVTGMINGVPIITRMELRRA